jgi:RNA-directed DNA polymerase
MQTRKTASDLPTALRGIANRANRDKGHRFGHLYTLLNEATLRDCYRALNHRAAVGIDDEDWRAYGAGLTERLRDLVGRLKAGRYRARLIRRKQIPKGEGKTRPLGIPVTEDKLLQLAAARILGAIYEADFLNSSWGYRPKRNARAASKVLAGALGTGGYGWVVEADIRGYFEHIDHGWLIRMLSERVHDRAFLRLIGKWLRAGVLEEDGRITHPVTGTPQGGVISPILANVYLHYALDLWFERRVRKHGAGRATLMRYADDFVAAFECEEDAKAFLAALKERLAKFGLELAEEKTRLVRFARQELEQTGTFDFLGFQFGWTRSRKGVPRVQRRTSPTRLRKSVAAFTAWIKENRHLRMRPLMRQLIPKLTGYWNYYGVSGNSPSLKKFWAQVLRLLYKWLNRRSHRRSYHWEGFTALLRDFKVPGPRITEPAYGAAGTQS